MTDRTVYPIGRDDDRQPTTVIGYMDLTDFAFELGLAAGGNKVYSSIEDLMERQPCVEHCGIVEVAVSFRKLIQEAKD